MNSGGRQATYGRPGGVSVAQNRNINKKRLAADIVAT